MREGVSEWDRERYGEIESERGKSKSQPETKQNYFSSFCMQSVLSRKPSGTNAFIRQVFAIFLFRLQFFFFFGLE